MTCPAGTVPWTDTGAEPFCASVPPPAPTWTPPETSTASAAPTPLVVEPPQPARQVEAPTALGGTWVVVALAVMVAAGLVAVVVVLRRDGRAGAVARAVARGGARALRWLWRGRAPRPERCRERWRARLARCCGLLVGALAALSLAPPALTTAAPLILLGACWLAGRRGRDPDDGDQAWWSHRRLVGALITAGVLRPPKAGEAPPMLSYRGPVRRDQHGATVTVALPGGRTAADVQRARPALAAALGIPLRLLEVTASDDDPASVVRLWVGSGAAQLPAVPPLATAERTRWAEPVRLGVDARGRPVHLATTGTHTALVGASGSGKTTAARLLAAHGLLDPDCAVYVVDGKGDAADWSDAAAACAGFVGTIDDDTPPRVAAIFAEVLAIARERAAASSGRGRRPWPGVLLLVEEWSAVRSHAATVLDRAGLEKLDRGMATLLATARSSGVHVVLLAQRLTADNLPTAQRANVAQRVVLRCLSPEDYTAALGCPPTGATPGRKGQALVLSEDVAQALVTVDYLTDGQWQAVCARASALRPARQGPTPQPASATPEHAPHAPPALPVEPPTPRDPLVTAVVDLLRDGDPRGSSATELLGRLPELLRPASAAKLGKLLRDHAIAGAPIEAGHAGSARVWRLAGTVGDPSAHRRPDVGRSVTDGPGSASHAQPGAPARPPSVPSEAGR